MPACTCEFRVFRPSSGALRRVDVFRGSEIELEFGSCLTAKNAKSPEKMEPFSSQADNQAITRRVSRNPREMSHIPLFLCSLQCCPSKSLSFAGVSYANAQGRSSGAEART
jgi:hypothetical protein